MTAGLTLVKKSCVGVVLKLLAHEDPYFLCSFKRSFTNMQRTSPVLWNSPFILPSNWRTEHCTHWTSLPSEIEIHASRLHGSVHDDDLTGVDTVALAHVAALALSTNEQPLISFYTKGGYNSLFRLKFPTSGYDIIARIPLPGTLPLTRISSTVASMFFARYFRSIPTPDVIAWNGDADNVVGAPYILMHMTLDVIEPWQIWHREDEERCRRIMDRLTAAHAPFLQPLPHSLAATGNIGQLDFANPAASDNPVDVRNYVLVPCLLKLPGRLEDPLREQLFVSSSTSLSTCWRELWAYSRDLCLQHEVSPGTLDLKLTYGRDVPESSILVPKSAFLKVAERMRIYVEKVLASFESVSALQPCLGHRDYAFRNVLIDATSLDVKSFIDWDDVQVLPLSLALDYPQDIKLYGIGLSDNNPWHSGKFDNLPPSEYPSPGWKNSYAPYDTVVNTLFRDYYKTSLQAADNLLKDPAIWDAREAFMQVQYLLECGGVAWWERKEWLERHT